MKRNQVVNILKVQHFKGTIPKFKPCLKKTGDFITPESYAKNDLRIARLKRPVTWPDDVVLRTCTRLRDCNTIRRVLAIHNINILVVF